jgi:alpha-galactosidase
MPSSSQFSTATVPQPAATYNSGGKALLLEGKCFDAPNNGTGAGTHVEIYDCLDVTGSSNPNGTGLELWTCNGGGNQHWTLG